MRIEKALLEKSVATLVEKADDCFDLAKSQHETADKQHEAADKQHEAAHKQDDSADELDTLGHALVDSAVEIKGQMELNVGRNSPPFNSRPNDLKPKAEPIPKVIAS